MYKIVSTLLAVIGMTTVTNAQQQDMNNKQANNKILVAYFSATGTTTDAAGRLATVTGGELYEIIPAKAYTDADLDWNNKRSRSSLEMNDPAMRPAIGSKDLNIGDYDTIFIGYPIWWDLAPRIINTFIEKYDLKGKTLVPFATSASSGITNSVAALKKAYPDLNWRPGRRLNGTDDKAIREWVGRL